MLVSMTDLSRTKKRNWKSIAWCSALWHRVLRGVVVAGAQISHTHAAVCPSSAVGLGLDGMKFMEVVLSFLVGLESLENKWVLVRIYKK